MAPEIVIERFQPAHLPAILRMEREAFGVDAWPRDLFLDYANTCGRLFFIAKFQGAIAAYSIACIDGESAELVSIAVSRRHRHLGLARGLIRLTVAKLRRSGVCRLILMVRRDNSAAIGLYRALGFVRTRTVPGYYEDGSTGWRMRLVLDSSFPPCRRPGAVL